MNHELSNHPKAVAARERASAQQVQLLQQRTAKQDLLSFLADENRLSFLDITPAPNRLTNGMTIAYTGDRVLKVSTAIRNPVDQYSKLDGRVAAAEAFNDGRWIYLRRPNGIKVTTFLRGVFSF